MAQSTNIFVTPSTGQYTDISNVFQAGSSNVITKIYKGGVDIGTFFNARSTGDTQSAESTKIYLGGQDLATKFAKKTDNVFANLISRINPLSYTSGSTTLTDSVSGDTWTLTNCTYNALRKTIVLNGSSSFIYYSGSIANWNTSIFTFVIYYYRTSDGNGSTLFNINRTSTNVNNQSVFKENSYFDYVEPDYGVNIAASDFSDTSDRSRWTMYTVVKNKATVTVYSNSTPVATKTGILKTVTSSHYCIGKDYRDNLSYLPGEIYFAGFWNVALNSTDVKNLYTYFTNATFVFSNSDGTDKTLMDNENKLYYDWNVGSEIQASYLNSVTIRISGAKNNNGYMPTNTALKIPGTNGNPATTIESIYETLGINNTVVKPITRTFTNDKTNSEIQSSYIVHFDWSTMEASGRYFDYVAVSNVRLAPVITAEFTPKLITTGLKNYYNITTYSSGNTLKNLINNENDITIHNNPTYQYTRTLLFNGTNQFLKCNNNITFQSISIWYKQLDQGDPNARYLFDGRSTASESWVYRGTGQDNVGPMWKNCYFDGRSNETPVGVVGRFVGQDNTWHNVTYTSNTLKTSTTFRFFTNAYENEPMKIDVAAILIYDRQITQEENSQNHTYFYNILKRAGVPLP